ncbi:hypothetical protein QR680_015057 [Steinernema hermaphroditum]|uniref:ATPase AAA-type core domain-containing protein n=1 Tax=Steinernema hermaphroditum TaxID=289476 RepID=A0AA39ICF5_9BILA|nr:hypothetical protein QR680_015057 [Steinernema hermaphroditum]
MKLIFVLLFTTLAFGCEKRNCHDIDGQQVCYDERCSNGESLGCNAGGQGQNCRFCGFGEFPPCGGGPSPLPLPSVKNEPQCSGMSPVSMAEFTRYAHNVGNQGFYNVNMDKFLLKTKSKPVILGKRPSSFSSQKPAKRTMARAQSFEAPSRKLLFPDPFEKCEPTKVLELAVQKTRVKQVQDWLENWIANGGNPYLILMGPPGCGKSTTVKIVCKSLGICVTEYESTEEYLMNDERLYFQPISSKGTSDLKMCVEHLQLVLIANVTEANYRNDVKRMVSLKREELRFGKEKALLNFHNGRFLFPGLIRSQQHMTETVCVLKEEFKKNPKQFDRLQQAFLSSFPETIDIMKQRIEGRIYNANGADTEEDEEEYEIDDDFSD